MNQLIYFLREALLLCVFVSLPVMGAALVVGLLVGALQAATHLSDPTIGIFSRLLVVAGVLFLASSWMGSQILRFARVAFEAIAR